MLIERSSNLFVRDEGGILKACQRFYDLAFEYVDECNAKGLITPQVAKRVQRLLDLVVLEIEKPDRQVGKVESVAFRVVDNVSLWAFPEDEDNGSRWWREKLRNS